MTNNLKHIIMPDGTKLDLPTGNINDIELNNPFTFGMSQYYKGIMNSGAWLRSNGQMNPKATYEGLYNWALTQLNAGVEGFKSSTASDITDYDFVINQTDESFRLPLKNGMEGVFASGIVPSGYNLYYYCGNVEENPHLVNVARIEEALVDKTSMAQASIASIPSNKYDNLTLLASEQLYVAPENGYFYLNKAGSSGQYISILNQATGISLYSEKTNYGSPCVLYRVKKGDKVTITYTTTGATNYFRFYYDIGASSVSPDKAVANHLDTINGEVV